jgi:hypothetical protein
VTSQRTPEEILAALDDEAEDVEMDRVLAMSASERRREIEAAGAGVDKLHERADAVHEEIRRTVLADALKERMAEARDRALRPPPSRLRFAALLAAAALAIAPVAFLVARYFGPSAPAPYASDHPGPLPAPAPSPSAPEPGPTPSELRAAALDDCANYLWRACLDKLDTARALDPAGDTTPEVKEARRQAHKAIDPVIDRGKPHDDKAQPR